MKHPTKTALAKDLQVSRSSLYYKSTMTVKDERLKEQILTVMEAHPAYGHKRIALDLGYNKKRILRVMKKFQLTPLLQRGKKPFKKEDLGTPAIPCFNYQKNFCPLLPGIVWASDFTYLWFQGKFLYLATVIDIVSKEIVGCALGNFHTTELVLQALTNALQHKPPPQYLHSDQGSEYRAEEYQTFVAAQGITLSLSKKASPWQNGFQESFYSNFKLELGTIARFSSQGELLEAIYAQLHYYHTKRIHSALKMTPQQYISTQKTYTRQVS